MIFDMVIHTDSAIFHLTASSGNKLWRKDCASDQGMIV